MGGRSARKPPSQRAHVRLRTGSTKLAALADDDDPLSDLRAVFSWSYIALDPEAQRMFRLLGLYPGPDLGVPAAAALAGAGAAEARRLLDRLVAASLLRVVRPGRFRLHDLVREYAQELAAQDPVDVRRPALTRLLDWYIHTAIATTGEAVQGVRRPSVLIPPDPPGDGVVPTRFTSLAAADEWLATEWPGVSPAVDAAATYGLHRHAAQLVCRWLDELHHRPPPEALRLQETALSAAVEIGDQALVALLHRDLGVTHAHAGGLLSPANQAVAFFNLAEAWMHEGRHDDVRALLAQSQADLPLDSHLTAIMHFISCRNEIAAGCLARAREHLDAADAAYERAVQVATRPLQLTHVDLAALRDSSARRPEHLTPPIIMTGTGEREPTGSWQGDESGRS